MRHQQILDCPSTNFDLRSHISPTVLRWILFLLSLALFQADIFESTLWLEYIEFFFYGNKLS